MLYIIQIENAGQHVPLLFTVDSSDILLTFPEPITLSPPSQQSYPSVCNTVAYPSGAGLNSIIQIFGNSESPPAYLLVWDSSSILRL